MTEVNGSQIRAVSSIRRAAVFCGSGSGSQSQFMEEAANLGRILAGRGIGVVYGGANIGLMGTLADAALAARGEVIGVLPGVLANRELAHPGITEMHYVETMHERKALMASLSDAFIALPGGYGTLDEFIEIVTWAQLRIHAKPCILINTAGYYDSMLGFFTKAVKDGFIKPENRSLIIEVENAESAVQAAFNFHSTAAALPELKNLP